MNVFRPLLTCSSRKVHSAVWLLVQLVCPMARQTQQVNDVRPSRGLGRFVSVRAFIRSWTLFRTSSLCVVCSVSVVWWLARCGGTTANALAMLASATLWRVDCTVVGTSIPASSRGNSSRDRDIRCNQSMSSGDLQKFKYFLTCRVAMDRVIVQRRARRLAFFSLSRTRARRCHAARTSPDFVPGRGWT